MIPMNAAKIVAIVLAAAGAILGVTVSCLASAVYLYCKVRPAYRDLIHNLLGPAPCPVPKINYHYRYRITLRLKSSKQLRLLLEHMLRQFSKDKENRGVSAFVDVNAME